MTEMKWHDLSSGKAKFAACKLLDLAITEAVQNNLRVDVLVWDTQDSRHNIQNRDDVANLGRMFFHLLRNVLDRRWPDNSRWAVYPDKRSDFDWEPLQRSVESKGTEVLYETDLFNPDGDSRLRRSFELLGIESKDSKQFPLIQVADLFAGLGPFSRERYRKFEKWRNRNEKGESLFGRTLLKLSNTDKARFPVLDHLDKSCKTRRLQVSLKSNQGLATMNAGKPINFWLWEPQHEKDKAPTKK